MFRLALRSALCTFLFLARTYGENYSCDQNDLRSLFVHQSRLSSAVNKLSAKTDSIDVLEQEIGSLKNASALISSVSALQEEADNLKDVLENTARLIKNLTDNNTKLSELIADFNMSFDDIGMKMQYIEDKVNASIKVINKTANRIAVAFIATVPNDLSFDISAGDVIVFPVIVLNEGKGYDNTSGVFTAPVSGRYSFSVAVCPHSDSDIVFYFYLNYLYVFGWFIRSDNNTRCHSFESVAVLSQGQKLWFESGYNSTLSQVDDNRWNTFSGVLVNG